MPARSRQDGDVTATTSGTPVFLGVIAFGAASLNNHSTAAPFNNTGDGLEGKFILLQATQDVYILPGTTNAAAVTTANGVLISAGERVIIGMRQGYKWLAAIRSSADGNLRVWELL